MKTPVVAALAFFAIGCFEAASTPDLAKTDVIPESLRSKPIDDQMRSSLLWSRFPDDEQGYWLIGSEAESAVSVENVSVQLEEPFPDMGYVPLSCQGHTLAGIVHNQTQFLVAEVELTVKAIAKESGEILAEMDTETMIPYRITEPGRSDHREVLLTKRFDQGHSPFEAVVNWPPFTINARVRRVRVIDMDAHLSYVQKMELEAAAYREAHKDDQGPKLYD